MLIRQDVMDAIDTLPAGKPMSAYDIRYILKREKGIYIEAQPLVRHLKIHPKVFVAYTKYVHFYEVRP